MFWSQLNLQAQLRSKLWKLLKCILKPVAEASKQQSETEGGPSEPTKVKSLEAEETKMAEPTLVEETDTAAPEASSKALYYIVRHASGKRLSEEEIFEANHYAREL